MNDELQVVPLAAFESQSSRYARIIKLLVIGWAVSVALLVALCVVSISYTEEAVTTTETVTQDADDYGNNLYTGGDYYGGYADDNEDDDNYSS